MAPRVLCRGKDAAQLVAVSERLHQLPVAKGTLKPTIGRLGEQCHRAPTHCRRVVLVDVVCEVEVLEEQACLFLASHLFGNGVRDQSTKRVHCMGALSFEWHGTPQAVGYLTQQRRLVEPNVAKPFHLTKTRSPEVGSTATALRLLANSNFLKVNYLTSPPP